MSLVTLLILVLIIALIAGMPTWQWHPYAWGPSGIVGIILIVVLLLVFLGRL